MTPAAWLITWPTGHQSAVICKDKPRYPRTTVQPLYTDLGLFEQSQEKAQDGPIDLGNLSALVAV